MGFVLLLLVIRLWAWQGKHSLEPSSIAKMAIGCFCLALSFLVLAVVAWQAGDGETSWLWLIAVFVLVALGELYVWPTGLSLVSQVAPARVVSLMMGLWLATGLTGNLMGGWLGGFWSNMHHANFFFLMAALATAAGVVTALLIRPLKSIVERRAVG
jgi:proton-dependent oligopeptide transporter, POT family